MFTKTLRLRSGRARQDPPPSKLQDFGRARQTNYGFLKFAFVKRSFLLFIPFLFLLFFLFSPKSAVSDNFENGDNLKTNPGAQIREPVRKQYPQAKELLDKRTENSKTFLVRVNPDGSKTYHWGGSIGEVHYKDDPQNPNETWKEIDTEIKLITDKKSGYDFQNTTNNFTSFFKKNSTDPDTVRYEDNGSFITFTNQDNELGKLRSVEGYAKNNQFIYPEAYDNIDIKYSIGTRVLLEEFVLKQSREVSRISQRVHFEDAEYQEQEDGSINFYSTKTNELVWSFPKPKMYELNERKDENFGLYYEITKEGNDYIVTKVIDQEGIDWLNSPERIYPLVIDTTLDLQVGASSDDCRRDKGPSDFFGLDGVALPLGSSSATWAKFGQGLRFANVTVPQASTISVAYFTWAADVWDSIATDPVYSRINGHDVDDSATFSTKADFDDRFANALTTAVVDYDDIEHQAPDNWYNSPSIVSIIQEIVDRVGWASGNALSIFWQDFEGRSPIGNTRQSMAYDYDSALAAKLHIEYTSNQNPNAPSSLGPTGLVDGSFTADNTPTPEFTLSDPDAGDTVKFQIQIDDTSDFSSTVVDYTSALAAQGATSFTVGQAAGSGTYTTGSAGQTLSDGSYYWRVKAIDNSAAESAYSTANAGAIAFKVDTTAPSAVSNLASSSHTTSTWSTDTTIDVSWTAATDTGGSGVAGYSYLFDTAATTTPDTTSDGTGTLTTSSAQSDGNSIYFHVRAIDNVGNAGSAVHLGPFYVDATAPTVPGTPSTTTPTADNTPTWTWTASTDASSGLHATTPYSVQWCTDSAFTGCAANTATSTTNSYTHSVSLSDNTWYFRAKATDAVSNASAYSSNGSALIDTTAPSVSVTALSPDPTTDTTPTLAGTATDTGTALTAIQFQVDSTSGSWSTCTADDGTIDETSETFTCTTAALADGAHTIYIRATDSASNTTALADYGTDTFTVDTGAPSVTLTAISPDPGTDTTPTITGTATDATGTVSTVQFQVDSTSGSWSSCTADDGTFDEASETFSCTTTALSDGSHTIYVRATDDNSNTSSNASDAFTVDTTNPVSFDLDSPGNDSYTNSERPSFKWKATTDTTAGLSKYVLEIDNPSIGSSQPSGDFTIDSIPTSRTTDYETNKYTIRYENFNDSDSTNNYISVETRSHKDWGTSENDGKLREGKVSWKAKAVDNSGNETSSSRTLFVDRTNPKVEFTQINNLSTSEVTGTGSSDGVRSYSTTDKTPTIFGKITDSLAGGDSSQTQDENGPKVASAPKEVNIKVERKEGLTFKLITLYKINMDNPYYTCDPNKTIDNSKQKCDKYLPFEYTTKDSLDLGTYKITLTGKDKADNSSSETTLTLNITTLAQITTPEEKKIIEEGVKELPQEEQKRVEEELEITKPTEPPKPNVFEKAGGQVGMFTSEVVLRLRHTSEVVLGSIGSGLTFVGNAVGTGYNNLANNAPGVTKNILLAVKDGAINIGNGISNTTSVIANAGNQAINNTKNGIVNIAFGIGEKTQGVSDSVAVAFLKVGYSLLTEPTRISNVEAVVLSPTSVKVSWKTNHPANGKVNWGFADGMYEFEDQTDKRTTHHEFVLTNLQPDTEYHYEVMSQNKNYVYDANRTFKTPPEK